jgi:hypothetical protein
MYIAWKYSTDKDIQLTYNEEILRLFYLTSKLEHKN